MAARRCPQVLIVEDDDDLRGLVGDLLRDEEFTAVEAPNGRAALDYLLGAPTAPSLILLDLNMPVMTGRQMLAELRGHPHLAKIPVIVMTSEPPSADDLGGGAVARLQKPYAAGHLIKLVREHAAAFDAAGDAAGDDGGPPTSGARRPRLVD